MRPQLVITDRHDVIRFVGQEGRVLAFAYSSGGGISIDDREGRVFHSSFGIPPTSIGVVVVGLPHLAGRGDPEHLLGFF